MNLRVIGYATLTIFSIFFTLILAQAYQTGTDPVTIPLAGIFFLPRNAIITLIMEGVILTPWTLLNLIGTISEAEWLNPSRLWATITAILFVFACRALAPPDTTTLAATVALGYCFVEGVTTVIEKRRF